MRFLCPSFTHIKCKFRRNKKSKRKYRNYRIPFCRFDLPIMQVLIKNRAIRFAIYQLSTPSIHLMNVSESHWSSLVSGNARYRLPVGYVFLIKPPTFSLTVRGIFLDNGKINLPRVVVFAISPDMFNGPVIRDKDNQGFASAPITF